MGYTAQRLQLQSLSYTKPGQTLLSLSYGYTQNGGNNGQMTSITDSTGTPEAGRSVAYTYDSLYRLKTAVTAGSTSYPQWGLSWTYDRYGNRTNQTQTAGNPPPNSLSFANPGGAQTNRPDDYAHDANGNMTNDGLNQLGYDAENHMVSAAGAAYTYDGAGLRLKKVNGSTTTVYIFSGPKVIAEYENGAAPASPTREYIYSGGQLLAKIEAGATKYYHQDHLSNRVLADSSGNVSGQRGHYPHGETWYESGATTKLKFTTYERDGETGNDYAMARYHVNRLGRFNSPDPIAGSVADPQSLNRYAYALNDPINLVDPLGLNTAACYKDGKLIEPDKGGDTEEHCKEKGGSWDYIIQITFYYFEIYEWDLSTRPRTPPEDGGLLDMVVGMVVSTLKKIECAVYSPLLAIAKNGNNVVGVGAGGSAGIGVPPFLTGGYVGGGAQVVADPQGNVGLAITVSGNPLQGIVGAGAVGGIQVSNSNAQTIYQTKGRSSSFGGSAGPVGVDVSQSPGSGPTTVTLTAGYGRWGKGGAVAGNYTWIPFSINCH